MKNALGDRLKLLRREHGTTQAKLASQLGVSTAYIGFLERGSRKGSDATLTKIAEFYKFPPKELIQLRDGSTPGTTSMKKANTTTEPTEYPSSINKLVNKLMNLDESVQQKIVVELNEELKAKLSKLLVSYRIEQLQKILMQVKDYWLSLGIKQPHNIPSIENVIGELEDQEQNYYFHLDLNESLLSLSLMKKDNEHIKIFKEWIGEPSATYETEDKLNHLSEIHKMITFIWFSPTLSTLDQLSYIHKKALRMSHLQCHDQKLKWFIQQERIDTKTSAG